MQIKTKLTQINRTTMKNKQNKYIVIHYVGAVNSAKANANYFYSINRQASAHYFVDENDIYQVVKEGDIAWHCGTTGTYYHPECRNTNSIGIEMCCYMNNGILDIKEEVINKTIELTKELMTKYNIPVENVIRHYDVTHKNCPQPFVKNENKWENFKSKLINLPNLQYKAHIENIGWTEWIKEGQVAGTEGESKRLEAIILQGNNGVDLKYRVHMQNIGWGEWTTNGQVAGTTGEARRIEAIEIQSNKKLKVEEHIQNVGWLPSSEGNNIRIGTEGKFLRLEAFKISVLE